MVWHAVSLFTTLALYVTVLAGLYLLGLGVASLLAPSHASRFLLGFGSSPSFHFTELLLRLVVGVALVHIAPYMRFSAIFGAFGWVLLLTTAVMLVVPWQWHRRFAQQAVTRAIRFMALIGVVSLSLGATVLFAVVCGGAD